MPPLLLAFGLCCLLACAKEAPVAAKIASGRGGLRAEFENLLGEGIAMGPERLGTTLHDKAATSRCSSTRDRLRPQVDKLRAQTGQLGELSIDDLSACVDCAAGGDQACSRAAAALERDPRP